MAKGEPPPDLVARLRACDVRESFIVQAPAGSGKTTLLTERLLALLSIVDAPEEVLAITFTRKAAAEMRERVLKALEAAENDAPIEPHEERQREFARAVLARSAEKGWNLASHPARLNIRTIDAFCNALAVRMPLVSKLGDRMNVADDADPCYGAAARLLLADLENDEPWTPAVHALVAHLENNLAKIELLLVEMLRRRDQWLRHAIRHRGIEAADARAALEAALDRAVCGALSRLRAAVLDDLAPRLVELAAYAAGNLAANFAKGGTDSPIRACANLTALPGADASALPAWKGIASLLLTGDDTVRKTVDARQGFPPGKKDTGANARKMDMIAVLDSLRAPNSFIEQLQSARSLPAPRYDDSDWRILQALLELLPVAVAYLRVVFAQQAMLDHAEIAQSALAALGTDAEPTDLLLSLDYRIRHVLVDEFQDVSLTQFELLRRLTSGWENGDGRTFFAVGDPMQSIYRFREAEVGVFLRARKHGIGALRLAPLRLTANFRSQAGIVDWVNTTFPGIFPDKEDIGAGAVTYAASDPTHPNENGDAVTMVPFFGRNDISEAERVVAIIREAWTTKPDATIAILVPSRGSLGEIATRMRAAGLSFQAVDIEELGDRPVVQDLFALTRALSHPADRIAWLAVLRARWCGLTLADLHVLCGDAPDALLPDLLRDRARLAQVSDDGRRRLARVMPALGRAEALRARLPIRRRVEECWLALGGPACVSDAADLTDASRYLDLLESHEAGGELASLRELSEQVQALRASPDAAAGNLQVLTIHKAKGLEFDVVIVPGLGRGKRRDERKLLVWAERPTERADSGDELLLAPIETGAREPGSLYGYIEMLERERENNETRRLLYVAATRAKKRLFLLGHTTVSAKDGESHLKRPREQSLLATLWPAAAPLFASAWDARRTRPDAAPPSDAGYGETRRAIGRLAVAWQAPPDLQIEIALGDESRSSGAEEIEFLWAGPTARHVGTVVHSFLMRMTVDGHVHWNAARIRMLTPHYRAALARLGVPRNEMDSAIERVAAALTATLDDARGRWLLEAHTDGRAEFALSGLIGGRIVNAVIDRTFVADHVRWIVDYKTGSHSGSDADSFLDQECERYRGQLETYALLMRALDPRPIRLGLYFPLLRAWRELQERR